MYKIKAKLMGFAVFLVIPLNLISCTSPLGISNEAVLKTQTHCADIEPAVAVYPSCSDKISKNKVCALELSDIKPTQFNYGKEYVGIMVEKYRTSLDKTQKFLCLNPVSIVIGPKSVPGFFLTDGHHRIKMIEQFSIEKSNKFTILVKVTENFMNQNPNQSKDEFWKSMVKNNDVYLKDNGVLKKPEELPARMAQLTNDPYRSLTAYIAEDKSKFCFDKNLPSYGNYAEFYWGDYFRKFKNLDQYTDQTSYQLYKNKILYFHNVTTGKRENICKLSDAEKLPGYTKVNELLPFLVLNSMDKYGEPKNFRTAEMIEKSYKGNKKGLNSLKISGSGQFSKQELSWMIKNTSKNLIIVDLRQEPHGFINGNPVTWTAPFNWPNIGKSKNNIIIDEAARLKEVLLERYLELPTAKNFKEDNFDLNEFVKLEVNTAEREDEIAKQFNVGYFRITVLDHSKPTDEDVDSFLKLAKNLKPDSWLHFHCAGGKGRTTTFLAMYDMLRNASSVSFDEIVARQASVVPYYDLLENNREDRKTLFKERADFLKEFYEFAKEYHRGYRGTWKDWKSSK